MEASTSDEAECGICFDSLTEGDRLTLPCQCRVPYCLQCWDRSLATAFNNSGRARCPSCRCPVRVDFDPTASRLVFSSDSADDATAEPCAEVINRLAEQAAPLMTCKLRKYGEEHPSLRAIARDPVSELSTRSVRECKALLRALAGNAAGCVEKADIIERCQTAAGSDAKLAAFCTSSDYVPEVHTSVRCVCGGRLERIGARARAGSLFTSQYPQLEPAQLEQLLDEQMSIGGVVICDLCDKQVSSAVWMCGNGEKTILHPTTYDVCESCFVRYSVHGEGDEALPSERAVAN